MAKKITYKPVAASVQVFSTIGKRDVTIGAVVTFERIVRGESSGKLSMTYSESGKPDRIAWWDNEPIPPIPAIVKRAMEDWRLVLSSSLLHQVLSLVVESGFDRPNAHAYAKNDPFEESEQE